MATLVEKVESILKDAFPGSTRDLAARNGAGRVFGVLSWDQFEGVEHVDRQSRLWALLRERLSRDEQRQISAILTMTPLELSDDEEPDEEAA